MLAQYACSLQVQSPRLLQGGMPKGANQLGHATDPDNGITAATGTLEHALDLPGA